MKGLNFSKIQNRLVFWVLSISLITLVASMLITYTQQLKIINEKTFNKLVSIRNLKADQLNKWIDERIGDVTVIAGDYDIRIIEKNFNKSKKAELDPEINKNVKALLQRYISIYNDYTNFYIINATTGLVEISTLPEVVGGNRANNEYFTKPLETGSIYIKQVYYSIETNEPEMTFSIPIYSLEDPKQIFGILVAHIDLENSLYKLLQNRTGLGETGESLVVNKDKIAINELRWYGNAPFNLKISAQPAVNAADGKTGIIKALDYRDVKVLAAYTYIPRLGWGLVVKQDLKELNAPVMRSALDFILIIFIASLIIVLFTVKFSRSFSVPIIKMNEIAQKMGHGDFSSRNTIYSKDELG